jgi:threonine dehydrogenase-like Zn-dependent dehydrogenase
MLQYVLAEPGRIAEKETAIPEPSGTQVLIRIRYVGICGSDIHLYRGSYNGPHSYPMLFGHEWSGVVEKVGMG